MVYYRSLFEFLELDERFKPGMTANLEVIVDRADQVLSIPRRALQGKRGERVELEVLTPSGDVETRSVELGLRGDFQVEVISGLSEGEEVIVGQET